MEMVAQVLVVAITTNVLVIVVTADLVINCELIHCG